MAQHNNNGIENSVTHGDFQFTFSVASASSLGLEANSQNPGSGRNHENGFETQENSVPSLATASHPICDADTRSQRTGSTEPCSALHSMSCISLQGGVASSLSASKGTTNLQDLTTLPPKASFLSIPIELRLQIYDIAVDEIDHKVESLSLPFSDSTRRPIMQLSLSSLARTCKFFAVDVRDYRSRSRPEQQFATIRFCGSIQGYAENLHNAVLERALCPIANLTRLKIILQLDPSPGLIGAYDAERSLKPMLQDMFDFRSRCNFFRDARKLMDIEVHVRLISLEKEDRHVKEYVQNLGNHFAGQIQKHGFGNESSMGSRVLRTVRLVECIAY